MPAARKAASPPPPPPDESSRPGEEGELPDMEKRSRSAKMAKLESAVGGLYIMLGGAMSTLPEQVGGQRVRMVGISVAQSSDAIAEAWIDLAEDDRRVLKALESLTSFSGWGKVVGVHLIAVGSAVPGIAGAGPMFGAMPPMQGPPQPQAPQGANGMTDEQAAFIASELFRHSQSQQRAQAAAAPPPGFGEAPPPPPPPQQQQQAGVRAVRTGPGPTRPGRGAGIPSASELFGGQAPTADVPLDFPSASDPQDAGM